MIIFWRLTLRFWLQSHVLRAYRRAAGGERKAGVNFEMDSLQKFMQHVCRTSGYEKTSKNTALGTPRPSPDAPRNLRNRVRGSLGQHLAARRHPRTFRRRPRSTQDAPKRPPRTLKRSPRLPKSRPRGAGGAPNCYKIEPRGTQDEILARSS